MYWLTSTDQQRSAIGFYLLVGAAKIAPLVHLRKENKSHLFDLALNALSPISLDITGDSMAVVAGTIYLATLVPRRGGIFSFDEAGAHGSLSITEDWCYDVVQGNSQYNARKIAPNYAKLRLCKLRRGTTMFFTLFTRPAPRI